MRAAGRAGWQAGAMQVVELEQAVRQVSQHCAGTASPPRVVTSGNFSPVLGHSIAMAFLPPHITEGDLVEIDVRGRPVAATVTGLPFLRR